MIVTTTSTIQGKKLLSISISSMEKRLWVRISFVTSSASVRDVVGGRAGAYESKLKSARHRNGRNENFRKTKNANAIVGIDVDYEVVREGMLMVAVSGTAVRI